ncbi:MAG: methyltransferase domain-containing protein [Comamonas sp.]|uniref:methyltransferase domain-containing protein n=1 Tax=Comamonas sp. TaxID=34028 RepID=UPI002FC92166
MERLDTSLAPERPNIEASIHFARYAIATPFVQGKKVLDIACGEGYGSHLLKQAGAKQVVGVDVSDEAVNRAKKSFSAPGVEFMATDAASVEREFPLEYFDVVVSCETIEHIQDPARYLQSLKNVAKKDAVFIISCPNDYWYFPEDHQRNPYHVRKYNFEEFKELTVGILGNNVSWSVGTAVMGFGSTPLDVKKDYEPVPASWMSFKQLGGAYLVNGSGELEVTAANCSYFFGVWNAADAPSGAAVFPVSMDSYARMVQAMESEPAVHPHEALPEAAPDCTHESNALRAPTGDVIPEVRKASLLYEASSAENLVLRESLHFSTGSVQALQTDVNTLQAQAHTLQAQAHAFQSDAHALKAQVHTLQSEVHALQAEVLTHQAQIRHREAEVQTLETQAHALRGELNAFAAEVPVLQAEIERLTVECAIMRVSHDRYVRLRNIVPQPVRTLALKVARAVRR